MLCNPPVCCVLCVAVCVRSCLLQARSRASALSDTPVALLCPAHLAHGASPGSLLGDPHVTCVMYSKQGELLASYNDEVRGVGEERGVLVRMEGPLRYGSDCAGNSAKCCA